jgi:hypothetical protein
MKHFYLALVCLLSPFILQAQANFKKGWVVNIQGDTLRGFINYQEWGGKEPGTLAFKTKEADKNIQEFTPAALRQAVITDLVAYQSFRGRISMDPTAINRIPQTMDTTKQTVAVFLKVVEQGKNVSLFSYTDDIKTRYFLQKNKDGTVQELILKKHYQGQSNNIRTIRTYIGQLWWSALELQLGTPALQRKIEAAQYLERDFVSIVRPLNQIDERQTPQQRQSNIRFFGGLGTSRSSFTVEGKHVLAGKTESKTSYYPKISLGLDVFQNRNIQRFFFRGELILHLAAADITGQQSWTLSNEKNNQSFLQSTFSVAPQLVYNLYNRENLKFNLGLGVSYNFSTYSRNIYHIQYLNRLNGQPNEDRRIKDHHQFTAIWFAIPLRAGLILNQKMDISFLYFMPAPISRYNSFSFSRSSLQAGVNYLFNRNRK